MMFKPNEGLRIRSEEFRRCLENALFFLLLCWGSFKLTGSCSVAEHDPIPSPIRWAMAYSGNSRGKEDVGLGDLKTERNMC